MKKYLPCELLGYCKDENNNHYCIKLKENTSFRIGDKINITTKQGERKDCILEKFEFHYNNKISKYETEFIENFQTNKRYINMTESDIRKNRIFKTLKWFGITTGAVTGLIVVLFIVAAIVLSPVIELEKRISNIDLDNIDAYSFKELTLIKQDYNKLSDFQKENVANYDIWIEADERYQKTKDGLVNNVKSWATVNYLPEAKNIKINSHKIVNKDGEYLYRVDITNNDKTKFDFKLGIKTYDETWTISNNEYSEKINFISGETRVFEFKLNPEKVDAVKIGYYEETIDDEKVLFDFGEQEILQIKK